MRVCARSDCSSPAVAILTYDREAQTAYLYAVDDPSIRSPGDLCERHLRRLVLRRTRCVAYGSSSLRETARRPSCAGPSQVGGGWRVALRRVRERRRDTAAN